jgi:hypothetical protein
MRGWKEISHALTVWVIEEEPVKGAEPWGQLVASM